MRIKVIFKDGFFPVLRCTFFALCCLALNHDTSSLWTDAKSCQPSWIVSRKYRVLSEFTVISLDCSLPSFFSKFVGATIVWKFSGSGSEVESILSVFTLVQTIFSILMGDPSGLTLRIISCGYKPVLIQYVWSLPSSMLCGGNFSSMDVARTTSRPICAMVVRSRYGEKVFWDHN